MLLLAWTPNSREDYVSWQTGDKQTLKRINTVIKDVLRSPLDGIGAPEPLKHGLSGLWSRRITHEHRLVYEVRGDTVIIHQCRYHYRK